MILRACVIASVAAAVALFAPFAALAPDATPWAAAGRSQTGPGPLASFLWVGAVVGFVLWFLGTVVVLVVLLHRWEEADRRKAYPPRCAEPATGDAVADLESSGGWYARIPRIPSKRA